MENITEIGGIFIKAKNPKMLSQWYKDHLGIDLNEDTSVTFKWINDHNPVVHGNAVLAFFKEGSDYFSPSQSNVMLNFRVKNLNKILHDLDTAGFWVEENIHYYDYGSFGWTMDPEGNKIELWEPKDVTL